MKDPIIVRGISSMFFLTAVLSAFSPVPDDHPTLKIGAFAPAFHLPGVDGKYYSLSSFAKARVLVVVFTCNHCPTAQSYEDRMIKLTADYSGKGVAIVAIMPNDPKSLRLDEMDFSDLGDSFEDMKIRAKDKKFNFPYLYDGDSETASRAYGPISTPHVFVFDQARKLRYTGRFDDTENHDKTPHINDTRNAIEALLNNQEIAVPVTKVFGCSVKWSEKRGMVQDYLKKWAEEPVMLDTIDNGRIQSLIKNESDKLRLINIWSVSNSPSTKEFNEFISINRMYRDRDFEFISLNTDQTNDIPTVLRFLRREQASNKNYIIEGADIRQVAKQINPGWNTAGLPITLIIEPGGKIVYTKQGVIDPSQLKRIIVENHLIGRYP
jgi:thiol-disulfide isomerase/thioredoxin